MRVLIIEDDEYDYLLLQRNLERAFVNDELFIERVVDPCVEMLAEVLGSFDVCFVDYRLQSHLGTEVIEALCKAGVDTPMILLTGDSCSALDQSALNAGASDYLHKDQLSVNSILRSTRHCIARKGQERQLREMAYTDALTGLANRAAFDARCDLALERVTSADRTLTLLLVDLDGFKNINDTFGHHCGDLLLQQFATDLKTHFNARDFIARLGGDEFAILVEANQERTTPEAERASLRLAQKTQLEFSGSTIDIKCSIGVSMIDCATQQMSGTDFLQRADRSLYADKRRRKFFEGNSLPDAGLDDLDLEETVQELESAIRNDDFEVFYQPKVNRKSGKITGLEALLRWPRGSSTLGPDIFIPIAEKYGLIKDIGNLVIRRCFQQVTDWRKQGFVIPVLSINVSPLQLEHGLLFQVMSDTLNEFEIAPEMIELELTESSFNRNADMMIEQMYRVASLGCRWAIDDFGIGHSSLSRLHKLPISTLKIDKSFLLQLPEDLCARDISNTIISLARVRNLGIVVEGVEDACQLTDLDLIDTDELQGFSYFRPMDSSSIGLVLKEECFTAA
jgi:diguanylate cyclase (GGDEF)-like protein